MRDFQYFGGVCPYCDAGPFDDEDQWFEHVTECEKDERSFPGPDDEGEQ